MHTNDAIGRTFIRIRDGALVRLMTVCEGYFMLRRPSCIPFLAHRTAFNADYREVEDSDELAELRNKLTESKANESEHARLMGELNQILHPNGDGPKNPSTCDLVACLLQEIFGGGEYVEP